MFTLKNGIIMDVNASGVNHDYFDATARGGFAPECIV